LIEEGMAMARQSLKVLAAIGILGVMSSCASWRCSREPASTMSTARIWNGGKPTLPVHLSTDHEGAYSAGKDTAITLFFVTDHECSDLTVRVRGVDGVIIVSSDSPQSLGACRPGEPMSLSVVVRVPEGISGYLAADVTIDERSGSLALVLEAEGAKGVPRSSGKVIRGSSGNSVVEIGNSGNSP